MIWLNAKSFVSHSSFYVDGLIMNIYNENLLDFGNSGGGEFFH